MNYEKQSLRDGVKLIVGDWLISHEIKHYAMGETTEKPAATPKVRPESCGKGNMKLKHQTLDDLS